MRHFLKITAILLIILSMVLTAGGCKDHQPSSSQRVENTSENMETENMEEKENTEMNMRQDLILYLMEQLECGERTAASIMDTFTDARIGEVLSITVVEKKGYAILEIRNTADNAYYATIGLDYTVDTIREGSKTGNVIYRDIA